MAQILLSEKAVTLYEILILLILLFLLVRQIRENRNARERRRIGNQKKRNLQLEEMLKNPDISKGKSKQPAPFDVQYVHAEEQEMDAVPEFQVEIEVHTETSVRRFLFDLDQQITIGRDENNTLPLKDHLVAKKNCLIFRKNHAVYVKNLNAAVPVFIQRGNNRQLIQKQMIKLKSRDVLTLGKTELHIVLYEN